MEITSPERQKKFELLTNITSQLIYFKTKKKIINYLKYNEKNVKL